MADLAASSRYEARLSPDGIGSGRQREMRSMDGKKRVRRRWSWPDYGLGAGTVAVIGVVVALLAVFVYHRSVDPASATERPENPYPKAEHRIAVLGDSFASGEGARAFWTDSKNCHRTWA